MKTLPPLNALYFFCFNGIHEATDCRCVTPVKPLTFWQRLVNRFRRSK